MGIQVNLSRSATVKETTRDIFFCVSDRAMAERPKKQDIYRCTYRVEHITDRSDNLKQASSHYTPTFWPTLYMGNE